VAEQHHEAIKSRHEMLVEGKKSVKNYSSDIISFCDTYISVNLRQLLRSCHVTCFVQHRSNNCHYVTEQLGSGNIKKLCWSSIRRFV
jgi:hypothetical protein